MNKMRPPWHVRFMQWWIGRDRRRVTYRFTVWYCKRFKPAQYWRR